MFAHRRFLFSLATGLGIVVPAMQLAAQQPSRPAIEAPAEFTDRYIADYQDLGPEPQYPVNGRVQPTKPLEPESPSDVKAKAEASGEKAGADFDESDAGTTAKKKDGGKNEGDKKDAGKKDGDKKDDAKKDEKKPDEPSWHEVGSDLGMTASWNNGLELATKNKDFRVHVGGRTQFDAAWFSVADNLNGPLATTGLSNFYGDGVDFRRARLRVDGTMYEVVDWAAEYDFVNAIRVVNNAQNNATTDHTVTAFTDLWWTIKSLPAVGNIRIGSQKEAIGFEHLVSSRYLPFMERSFNQDSFYGGAFNGFTPGIQAFNAVLDERATWSLGAFKPTDNVFSTSTFDGDYSIVGRLTALPWYVEEGKGLLHVGGSFRQATTVNSRTRYRTRGPVRAGLASQWPIPADTGTFFGEDQWWLNGELVGVYGPITFQAEYLTSFLNSASLTQGGPELGTVTYHGGYVQLLYFLTGEHDQYNRKTGFFERVKPAENVFFVPSERGGTAMGLGAWQVGARYNFLDLNDQGVNGGILHDMTAGLNWFWNPNMKMQFNYSAMHRDSRFANGDGWIHGWGVRLAHDF